MNQELQQAECVRVCPTPDPVLILGSVPRMRRGQLRPLDFLPRKPVFRQIFMLA